MPTFRNLPFQYQQRGPELARASKQDVEKFGRFTEQRDQDLENYLAGLGSGLTSVAGWTGTELVGGGTTVPNNTPSNVDLAFDAAIGPNFDQSTGEWVGPQNAMILVIGYVQVTVDGLGFTKLSGFGTALNTASDMLIVGIDSPVNWKFGGVYFADVASYNAIATLSPASLLGSFTRYDLSPATTFVDASLTEPLTITMELETSLIPPYVVAVG